MIAHRLLSLRDFRYSSNGTMGLFLRLGVDGAWLGGKMALTSTRPIVTSMVGNCGSSKTSLSLALGDGTRGACWPAENC
jgi:hypothetical protein